VPPIICGHAARSNSEVRSLLAEQYDRRKIEDPGTWWECIERPPSGILPMTAAVFRQGDNRLGSG